MPPLKNAYDDGGMGRPWGIAFGQNGMWAVTDYHFHCVYIFDRNNNLKFCFGEKGKFEGQFFHPAGVAFDYYNNIYVADTYNNRIQKFNCNGNYILDFNAHCCIGVVVAPNQKVYVAGNKCLSVYQTNGQYECSFNGNSKLIGPNGIGLGNNQIIVLDRISDYDNCSCIHIFTLNGDYVWGFGRGDLRNPRNAIIDYCGFFFVADDEHVVIFDKKGKKIHCFGSSDYRCRQLSSLNGIALNSYDNDIYVTDFNNKQIRTYYLTN